MTAIATAVAAAVDGATIEDEFQSVTVTVPSASWCDALRVAHDLGAGYFDFLTGYDADDYLTVIAHVATPTGSEHFLVATNVAKSGPTLATITDVYRGASWHERETAEMFGIDFAGHPNLAPLLLSPDFDGYPLRKGFVLGARVETPWPGTKEPGGAATRRPVRPLGVPDD